MAGISADLINPFLMAATSIMKDICQTDMSIGKPYVKKTEFEDETVAIMIGITGEMKGQVLMAFSYANALNVASRMMMGMPVPELDDMAMSAISELGNMIMGNAATVFSVRNIGIDITPPTVGRGTGKIDTMYSKNIAIPLLTDDSEVFMEMNIAMKIG